MISIQIRKKDLYLLAAIMIFLVGVTYVIAYNPSGTGGVPSVMGHSADELEISIGGATKTIQQAVNDGSLGGKIWFMTTDASAETGARVMGMFNSLQNNQPSILSCKGSSPGTINLDVVAFCNLSTSNGKAYLNLTWRQGSDPWKSTKIPSPYIDSPKLSEGLISGWIFCRTYYSSSEKYRVQIYEDRVGTDPILICQSSELSV